MIRTRMVRASLIQWSAVLALVAGAAVAHSGELAVRPLADGPRDPRLPAAAARALIPPAGQRTVQLRSARQRDGEALQRIVLAPGRRIDRSRFASRRTGWTPPPGAWRDGAGEWHVSAVAALPPDTVHLAILRVDFLHDRGGFASTGDGRFDLSGPDTTALPIDRPPHDRNFYQQHAEALKRYYDVQSYGRVVFQVDVLPAGQDSAFHLSDMADYGPWAFGSNDAVYRAAVHMFRDMFFAADTQSAQQGQRIDWQKYDRFTVIHAGGDLQSDLRIDSKEDIPSFTVFLDDTNRIVFSDSALWNRQRPIDRCSFIPETINQDGYYGALNGVLAHENGHNCFGFLDVYNIETGYPVCGYWTLMDSGNLLGSLVLVSPTDSVYAVGLLPPSIDPLQRNFISDGMDIRVPVWGDTIALADNERHNIFYKVPLSSDEYLLLENRYLAPSATVRLDADSATKVVLGPRQPDRFGYDALEPGGGILVWHIDESVVPFERSLRINPDFGFNTNPDRLADQVVEADGLDDLGDPGSPYILGSVLDPYQRSINPSLSDSTQPNLRPNIRTRTHLRIDFLDDADSTMHFTASRSWALPGFPVIAHFPPGGPVPLAIDADGNGDRNLEICWAGGDSAIARGGPSAHADSVAADSAALFAVRVNGQGLAGPGLAFAHLDRRPRPVLAAVLTGDPNFGQGPALFAATTYAAGIADTAGGKVWFVDHLGVSVPGWPVKPPAPASTPPVIAGIWPEVVVFVGAEDGHVYAFDHAGQQLAGAATGLGSPIRGRLAFWQGTPALPAEIGAPGPADTSWLAAADQAGHVAVFRYGAPGPVLQLAAGWPQTITSGAHDPEFLWLVLGGAGAAAEGNCAQDLPTLVAHDADRLWAFCPLGGALPGWGRSLGDTIITGLAAGDPDGDGFPEVLVQTRGSRAAFVNRDGFPSPGWPKPTTSELLPTATPALSLDVDGDGRSEVVSMNGSGLLTALKPGARIPEGWPLATGAGAAGSLLATDLNRDGHVELVAPDRDTLLYVYSLPIPANNPVATSWTMVGGDPGRTSALPLTRTPTPAAPSAGPLVDGSFKAYPNPARRRPVMFAYTLSEDAQVEYRILDASGHEVAAFTRHGGRADNVDVWDPGALPAGLYLARVRFAGARGAQLKVLPVGLLR